MALFFVQKTEKTDCSAQINLAEQSEKENKNNFILHINEEREIPGRQKVVRGLNVPVLTSHAGLNPRSKSGYEPERRVINHYDSHGHDTASYARVYQAVVTADKR